MNIVDMSSPSGQGSLASVYQTVNVTNRFHSLQGTLRLPAHPNTPLPHVVIVHRRRDSEAVARRLRDALASGMPDVSVEIGIEGIASHPDREVTLGRVVGRSSGVLVLVGQSWPVGDSTVAEADADVAYALIERARAAR